MSMTSYCISSSFAGTAEHLLIGPYLLFCLFFSKCSCQTPVKNFRDHQPESDEGKITYRRSKLEKADVLIIGCVSKQKFAQTKG